MRVGHRRINLNRWIVADALVNPGRSVQRMRSSQQPSSSRLPSGRPMADGITWCSAEVGWRPGLESDYANDDRMKPDTHTVQQLFERDVRYSVPLYQRPYVWDEERQWAPLWEDLSALLQHQESGAPSDLWSHFLGAIVLDQEQTIPGQIPRFTVIDGQQRLTTLQLLIAAAARSLAEIGAENDSALLSELAVNNPLRCQGSDRLKVWPTNANRDAFIAAMTFDSPPAVRIGDPRNLINEAFAYFKSRTAEYLAGDDDEVTQIAGASTPPPTGAKTIDPDVAARAVRLRITLCDLLKVVSITLDRDDNAQVIFETLNARGTPLLALDLVKNAVFGEVARQSSDPSSTDELYYGLWQPELDRDSWREDRRQGRLNRPTGELFLMHWLTMRLERVIPATELFATFRQSILQPSVDVQALIRELCADAALMRSFDNPPPNTPEAQFFRRLGALDASTILPIVLLLFRSAEVSQVRRRRALRMLESWLARRALMRLTAKNYNRLVPRLVAKMKADLEHADDALLAGLSGGEGEISRWPADGEFRDFLTSRDAYGNVSQPRLVMALAAVEAALYSSKTDIPQLAQNLSLEHLMPQGWEQNWLLRGLDGNPLQGEQLELATEERTMRINRLGNLSIVTQPLNASLSNSAWSTKRKALNAHSKLLLNARLTERETWDEDAIDARGAWLADQLVSIWPGPALSNWAEPPEPTATWRGPASENRTTKPAPEIHDAVPNVVDRQSTGTAAPGDTQPSIERTSGVGSDATTAPSSDASPSSRWTPKNRFRHTARASSTLGHVAPVANSGTSLPTSTPGSAAAAPSAPVSPAEAERIYRAAREAAAHRDPAGYSAVAYTTLLAADVAKAFAEYGGYFPSRYSGKFYRSSIWATERSPRPIRGRDNPRPRHQPLTMRRLDKAQLHR